MVSEDLAPYFAEFGVSATIAAGALQGIFDARPGQAFGFVDTVGPTFTFATAGWPAVARGAAITIASVAYTVTGIEPDGTGVTVVTLQRA